MEGKAHELEVLIAAFAARQRGNVARRQLLAHGARPAMIDRRLRIGALTRQFRGIYYAGHGPQPHFARECAAVLACAPRALVSRRAAGVEWGLPVAPGPEIEIVVVGREIRGPSGLRATEIGWLAPGELRRRHGVPITSPALTVLDLAGELAEDEMAKVLNEARVTRIVRNDELEAVIAAHPKRRGARALARHLALEHAALATESEAEALCLRLMIEHGVPPDDTQAMVGPYRVDFLYRAERLIVEVDGYRYHGTRHRFVRDRRRMAALAAMGFIIFPVSWADLVTRSVATMRSLERALIARRAALKTS